MPLPLAFCRALLLVLTSAHSRFRQGPLMPDWLFRILGYREGAIGRPAQIVWPAPVEHDPQALREAKSRIEEILEVHPIFFNGAGEDDLPSISQAWDVAHTDEATHVMNLESIRGIAEVLTDFPFLRCEVSSIVRDRAVGFAPPPPPHPAAAYGAPPVMLFVRCTARLAWWSPRRMHSQRTSASIPPRT